MVHAELFGNLLEVDLHSPRERARAWFAGRWITYYQSNEEVLFNPDTHMVRAPG